MLPRHRDRLKTIFCALEGLREVCQYQGRDGVNDHFFGTLEGTLAFSLACAKPEGQPEVKLCGLSRSFLRTCPEHVYSVPDSSEYT